MTTVRQEPLESKSMTPASLSLHVVEVQNSFQMKKKPASSTTCPGMLLSKDSGVCLTEYLMAAKRARPNSVLDIMVAFHLMQAEHHFASEKKRRGKHVEDFGNN